MAGFAVFMTILTYAFVALVGASILSVKLYRVAKKRVSEGLSDRKAMAFGAAAPFLGVLWLLIAFLVHVQISNRLAHQDCGLSGDPYVTLPNGYVVGSLNTYSGYFKAPGYETDVPIAGPGYVRSLVDLKFSDPYFIGTQFDSHSSGVRRFVFDTRTLEFHAEEPKSSGKSEDAWGDAQAHAHDDLDSYWNVYNQYRHSWPQYVFIGLILIGEVAIFQRLRKIWGTPPSTDNGGIQQEHLGENSLKRLE
jgi:hypothetical protein